MRARAVWPLLLVLPLAACGDDGGSGNDNGPESGRTTPTVEATLPVGDEPVTLDPATFTTDITNEWWPMKPGTRWTYRETSEDEVLTVVVTVTSQTREIANGVTARVVRDTVSLDGELVEDTFDWYAQDADGNIWYLGEDTAEFEDGELASQDGSFEAGIGGALPGIAMPADPQAGLGYRQEYLAGEAEDEAVVLELGASIGVPAGDYTDLLVTEDTNPLEPDIAEHKYYARGIGLVLAEMTAGGSDREELLEVTTVDARTARLAGTTPLGEAYP